jgi:hypothetical protein
MQSRRSSGGNHGHAADFSLKVPEKLILKIGMGGWMVPRKPRPVQFQEQGRKIQTWSRSRFQI